MFDGTEGSIYILVTDDGYDMLSWTIVRSSDGKGCHVGSHGSQGMLCPGSKTPEGWGPVPDHVGYFTMQDH